MSQVLALRRVWSAQGEPLERRLPLLLLLLPCDGNKHIYKRPARWLVACVRAYDGRSRERLLSFSGRKQRCKLAILYIRWWKFSVAAAHATFGGDFRPLMPMFVSRAKVNSPPPPPLMDVIW